MNKTTYIIIFPNLIIDNKLTIWGKDFKQFLNKHFVQTEDENYKNLILNFKTGLSYELHKQLDHFVYAIFEAPYDPIEVVSDCKNIITLLQYIILTEKNLPLEHVTCYIAHLIEKIEDPATPEDQYFFYYGINGDYPTRPLYAPGIPELPLQLDFPNNIQIMQHYPLIETFNRNQVKEEHLRAMDRFNQTYNTALGRDYSGEVLNISTAFENIFKLKKGKKKEKFGKEIFKKFKSNDGKDWAEEFYDLRNYIVHGNERLTLPFQPITKTKPVPGGKLFYWKHKRGKTPFRLHSIIAREIFKLCLANIVLGEKLDKLDIEVLVVPNEVHYDDLRNLVEQNVPFGEPYFEIISKLTNREKTGDYNTIRISLNFILDELVKENPDFKNDVEELKKIEDVAKLSLAIHHLSRRVRSSMNLRVIDDRTMKLHHIHEFLDAVAYTL